MRLAKSKQAKLKYKPKLRKISVSGLLKEFNQEHTNCAGNENPVNLLDITKMNGMYILFAIFCS